MDELEAKMDGGQGPVEAVGRPERSPIDEVLHCGARQMLVTVIEAEVADLVYPSGPSYPPLKRLRRANTLL